jgi:bacterioferritin (cytochrome b1)
MKSGTFFLEEERHIDWLETQLNQIKQMGFQNFLADQTN